MNKRVIYRNVDGAVHVLVPADDSLTIEEVAKNDTPEGVEYFIVDVSKIPSERLFRDAWELDKDNIVVNFEKAKEYWSNLVKPIFSSQLADFLIEGKDIKKEIEDKLNQIKNVKDLEALKPIAVELEKRI
jgi:hypothetical protein